MGTKSDSESDADSSDTDARIDTSSSAADRLSDTANMVIPALFDSAIGHNGRSRFFDTDDGRMDATEFIHMIERIIRWYRHRWGIENGFKKQKHFMVRTTSTERNYRFFNFAFACVLYNVWRWGICW